VVGNESLFVTLMDSAIRSIDGTATYFALQHRHPDGEHWLEVGRFATQKVAELAMDAFIAAGHGERSEFRVAKVRVED
jgi:hypothetical protein